MRGSFTATWQFMCEEIWEYLYQHEDVKTDIFCELYRTTTPYLNKKISVEEIADITDNALQARDEFLGIKSEDFRSEFAIRCFMQEVFDTLDDYSGDKISLLYFELLSSFVGKYNLKYEVTPLRKITPNVYGMFLDIFHQLDEMTKNDPHLGSLVNEFKNSVQDLSIDQSESRLKICIQKKITVLEAIASKHPLVKSSTLGSMCDDIISWPHSAFRLAIKQLYGFASDYPGIRHAGNPGGVLRPINISDLTSLLFFLSGLMPYLFDPSKNINVFTGTPLEELNGKNLT